MLPPKAGMSQQFIALMPVFVLRADCRPEVSDMKTERRMDTVTLVAPVSGHLASLESLADGVFSAGIVGRGVVIDPDEGAIFSPVQGVVVSVHSAGHAYLIRESGGVEILVHLGLESVRLGRRVFFPKVQDGAHVKPGDVLGWMDLDALKAAPGVKTLSPIVVTNSGAAQVLRVRSEGHVDGGRDPIMWVRTPAEEGGED